MRRQPTSSEIRNLLIHLLTGATEAGEEAWGRAITAVHVHRLATHRVCNWTVSIVGTKKQREAAKKAIEVVRSEHPYAERG